MIPFAPIHFEALTAHAYSVYDRVKLESFYDMAITKATWLSLWAKMLGYKDWGDLKYRTHHAHSNNQGPYPINSSNIDEMANRLRHLSGMFCWHHDEIKEFISNGTPDGGLPMPNFANVVFRLGIGPADPYQDKILFMLTPNLPSQGDDCIHRKMQNREAIEESLLRELSRQRKGLSKGQITSQRLDIYAKKSHSLKDIIDGLIDGQYIACDENNILFATDLAEFVVTNRWSNDFDADWQRWWLKFRSIFESHNPGCNRNISLVRMCRYFHDGYSPERLSSLLGWSKYELSIYNKVVDNVRLTLGIPPEKVAEKRIFHVTPLLLLDPGNFIATKDVQFKLISAPAWMQPKHSIGVYRYNPNKSHVRVGTDNKTQGWLCEIPEDIDSAEFTFEYVLPTGKVITHEFNVTFKHQNDRWFYSFLTSDDMSIPCYTRPISYESPYYLKYTAKDLGGIPLEQLPRIHAGLYYAEFNGNTVKMQEEITLIASTPHTLNL